MTIALPLCAWTGTSATSPALCVGIAHPTLRFFAPNDGPVTGTLEVEVEDALGKSSRSLGPVLGHSTSAPTMPLPVVANLLALLPDERTPVAFRFIPVCRCTRKPACRWPLRPVPRRGREAAR